MKKNRFVPLFLKKAIIKGQCICIPKKDKVYPLLNLQRQVKYQGNAATSVIKKKKKLKSLASFVFKCGATSHKAVKLISGLSGIALSLSLSWEIIDCLEPCSTS